MIKIRLEGLQKDIESSIKELEKIFNILNRSKEYKNRYGEYVRVYLDCEDKV